MPLPEAAQARRASNAVEKEYLKLGKNVLLFLEITVLIQIGAAFAWSLEMLGRNPTPLHSARSSFY